MNYFRVFCNILLPLSWMHGLHGVLASRAHQCQKNRQDTSAINLSNSDSTTEQFPSTPVIGVLAQPYHPAGKPINTTSDYEYIAASYVKWLEAGGARAIAIPYHTRNETYLDDIFFQVHTLFLPGGASQLPYSVTYLLEKAYKTNLNGNYFPVWGTCLGFEFLIEHFGSKTNDKKGPLQTGFAAHNVSWPLEEIQQRQLYRKASIYNTVAGLNVTFNYHQQGIEPQQFQNNSFLSTHWHAASINHDSLGRPFVSTIEPIHPRHFPFYGVQYHPEKNAYEYATYPHSNIPYEQINHSDEAVTFSNDIARFVVQRLAQQTIVRQQRRRNQSEQQHMYTDPDRFPIISTTYPVVAGLQFEQIYLIPSGEDDAITEAFA